MEGERIFLVTSEQCGRSSDVGIGSDPERAGNAHVNGGPPVRAQGPIMYDYVKLARSLVEELELAVDRRLSPMHLLVELAVRSHKLR